MKDLVFVLRLLQRHPMMFLTNIVGLTIALTMTILAITYIRFELSYDKHFPTNDRAVRLYHRVTDNTSTVTHGISMRDSYSQLPGEVPEIEAAVQLYEGWPTMVKSHDLQLNLDLVKQQQDYLNVRAPVDGQIGSLLVEIGQSVGQWIFVLDESGSFATKRQIRIGRKNPQFYELTEGLLPGEQVIVSDYTIFGTNDKVEFK